MNEAKRRTRKCAYCGTELIRGKNAGNKANAYNREHVVASQLFHTFSTSQRITIPSCRACNASFSDDENHFRNVVVLAGPANEAATDRWREVVRGFKNPQDGRRRLLDVARLLQPPFDPDNPPAQIRLDPASDERVLRVVRKHVRGLCHHLRLRTAVPDDHVLAQRSWDQMIDFAIQDGCEVHSLVVDPDVFQCQYVVFSEYVQQLEFTHSWWWLTYYRTRRFMASVFTRPVEEAIATP